MADNETIAPAATSTAASSPGALATIGSGVSSILGGIGDAFSLIPGVGGFLDSGFDKLGDFSGSLVSLGSYKPAATGAALPVGADALEQPSLLQTLAKDKLGTSVIPKSQSVVFSPEPRKDGEAPGAWAERVATKAIEFSTDARLAALSGGATDLKSIAALGQVNIFSAKANALKNMAIGSAPVSEEQLNSAVQEIFGDATVLGALATPSANVNYTELQKNLDPFLRTAASPTGGVKKIQALPETAKSPVLRKYNSSAAAYDREAVQVLADLDGLAGITDPAQKEAAAGVLAQRLKSLNDAKISLDEEYGMLSNKEFTKGWKKYNWLGEDLGVDWTAVTGMMSVLSPLAIAGISYYQAEKTAKRAHKWAVEDREDTQAFTAEENAATRASNEAMAAMESEDDSSGSVGASSAGSIGGSIASA